MKQKNLLEQLYEAAIQEHWRRYGFVEHDIRVRLTEIARAAPKFIKTVEKIIGPLDTDREESA